MLNLARQYLEKIENFPIKFTQLLAWVYFICVLRTFLEAFTNRKVQLDDILVALVYNPVYYLVHFSVIAIIFFIFTRAEVYKIIKTIYLFSFFIFVCPIVDYFFPFKQLQSYINVQTWEMVARAYLSLGLNDIYLQGTSLGLKVEGLLALLGVAGYLFLKRVNLGLAILGSLLVYGIIGVFGLMPTIFNALYDLLGLKYAENNLEFVIFQYLILGLFALALFYLQSPEKFSAYCKTVNWFRGSIALTLFFLGLGSYYYFRLDPGVFMAVLPFNLLKILAGAVAAFLVWQASRLINDLSDYEFDQFGENQNVLKRLEKKEIINILIVYMSFIAALSLSLNYYFFLAISLCLGLSYFYSGGGLHLKRHFLTSSLAMASAGSLIFLSGFFALFGKNDFIDFIPFRILQLIFLIIFLAVSFKDVKDELGDKRQSVKTIFTVFGPARGLCIVRVLIFACVLLPVLILKSWLLLLPGLAAYLLIYFFTRGFKKIDRKAAIISITLIYLFSVILTLGAARPKLAAGDIDLNRDGGWHPEAAQEIWFLSARLSDQAKRPYYVFQTYSLGVGSFFTLIGPQDSRFYKEFYPDNGQLAGTKNDLNLFQYISGYGDADKLYQTDDGNYKYHAMFEKGMIDLDLRANNTLPILLTESGRLPILNKDYLNYYALPDLSARGKLIFGEEKKVGVSGEAILEHFWGNIRADYRFWAVFSVSLDNNARLLVNIFNYGEKNLIYGALIEQGSIKRFDNLELKALNYYENPATKSRWFEELEISNRDLGFELVLKAQPAQQEVRGQNLWEGLMRVSGKFRGQPVLGWSNYRQVGSIPNNQP